MTTRRDTDTAASYASPLRPFLNQWAQQSGALSALPGAPVVPDRPRRGPWAWM